MSRRILLAAVVVGALAFLAMLAVTLIWMTVPERIVYQESSTVQTPAFSVEVTQHGKSYFVTPEQKIKGLFLRRYKKHVQEQVAGSFLERKVSKHGVPAAAEEEVVYDRLAAARFLSFDQTRRSGQLLFKTVLEKSLFSSPAACLETVRQRLKKLEKEFGSDADKDRATLGEIAETLGRIGPGNFAKYRRLVEILQPGGYLQWNPDNPKDRIVIFTERLETLRFLEEYLTRDLKLTPEQVEVVHGSGIEDVDLQKIVEDFGRDRSPVRLLLASDIASEGLNLHFLCHKLIHFDIPWSLMVFQQRNGRIDRYGQEREPHIAYLYTESQHPKVRGDLRILELLMKRDLNSPGPSFCIDTGGLSSWMHANCLRGGRRQRRPAASCRRLASSGDGRRRGRPCVQPRLPSPTCRATRRLLG